MKNNKAAKKLTRLDPKKLENLKIDKNLEYINFPKVSYLLILY
ncbi:hypothetical protein OAY51_00290 [Candidatus Pelagibacter sp.]|nr:hypothetical protein [Candidatus Pelagibacter sp.]